MVHDASTIISEVVTNLQSIAGLSNRVISALTEEELVNFSMIMTPPGVGVVYEGITTMERKPAGGAAGNLHLSLAVFYKEAGSIGQVVSASYRSKAVDLLDSLRRKMWEVPASNGKSWQFESELNPVQKGTLTLWLQRWTLPVILL